MVMNSILSTLRKALLYVIFSDVALVVDSFRLRGAPARRPRKDSVFYPSEGQSPFGLQAFFSLTPEAARKAKEEADEIEEAEREARKAEREARKAAREAREAEEARKTEARKPEARRVRVEKALDDLEESCNRKY